MNNIASIGSYEYIIIGGGTAGCVLANRLSADPAISVLMLEAGGRDNYLWIHIPAGYLHCIGNPSTGRCFRTEPEPGVNGRSIGYPRGRVLGGSSSINGMIYKRGQQLDFEQWQAQGNPGWGWDDVLPYYKRSEDYARGADEMHNNGGEWRVEPQRLSWEILDAFRDAAAETGIPRIVDFNRGNNEGCGYFEVNQKRGVRWNAAKGFLRPALDRPNLKVITAAPVRRLRLEGKRVTGVEFWQGNQLFQADAGLETVLAAAIAMFRHRPGGLAATAWHPGAARAARGRREPAGSPAAAHGVQGEAHPHAERNFSKPARAAGDGAGIPAVPQWTAVDVAQPAGGVRALGPEPAHAQPGIPRAAAVAGQVRRSAA
jgi:choline dehydrogenase-like flavoprotein